MLHMLCGKIGAGKSTLAKALAAQEASVLISEDAWLDALFGDRMATGADYMQYAAKLRTILAPHVADLLSAGVCVVLDFPANTVDQRAWMRDLVAETGTDHALHVLDVPDAVCLARLHARNAAGEHPFKVTDALFHAFTKHFAPPTAEEGFKVVTHRHDG
jgi:predicted kinase